MGLIAAFRGVAVVPEAPVDVLPNDPPTSEPVPDVIVLKPGVPASRDSNPKPFELQLIVEVAD